MRAYGRSKLCNILFTRELASRLDPGEVVATCLHPGMVATAIGQRGGLVELGWRLMKPFMISPEKGAETPVFLATVPDPEPFPRRLCHPQSRWREPDPAALRQRPRPPSYGTRAPGWSETRNELGLSLHRRVVRDRLAGRAEMGARAGQAARRHCRWRCFRWRSAARCCFWRRRRSRSARPMRYGPASAPRGPFWSGCGCLAIPSSLGPLSRRRADHRRRDHTQAGPLNKIGDSDDAFEARASSAELWQARQRQLLPALTQRAAIGANLADPRGGVAGS